jgi:hypothetical protein
MLAPKAFLRTTTNIQAARVALSDHARRPSWPRKGMDRMTAYLLIALAYGLLMWMIFHDINLHKTTRPVQPPHDRNPFAP